jgi:hypothetical protein
VVLMVLSIFSAGQYALLHGAAYACWAISLVPTGLELRRVLRVGLENKGGQLAQVA